MKPPSVSGLPDALCIICFVSKRLILAILYDKNKKEYVEIYKKLNFITKSIEQNLSQASSRLVLAPMFEHLFLNAGYFISTNRQKADYILKIATNTTAKSQSNGLYSTALNGQIQLYYKDRVVYDRFLNNISGTQLDYVKAGLSAYEEGVRQIEIRYFREFEAAIVKQ